MIHYSRKEEPQRAQREKKKKKKKKKEGSRMDGRRERGSQPARVLFCL